MVHQLSPAQVPQWLQSVQGRPVLLDVREPWEIARSSIQAPGFSLLTIPTAALVGRWSELDRTQPVACLCQHGIRSLHVARFLLQQGFTQVVSIAGGVEAWLKAHPNPSLESA